LLTLAAGAVLPVLASEEGPKHFSPEEFQLLTQVVDLIIPRTETPGAADVGVPRYIDRRIDSQPELGDRLKQALATLRATGFSSAAPARQTELLAQWNELALAKDLTIDGYYSSHEGLVTELGYKGNTYLSEFKGCTHPEHQS
jgi:hypothetical protein